MNTRLHPIATTLALAGLAALPAQAQTSADAASAPIVAPSHVTERPVAAAAAIQPSATPDGRPIIRVYRDTIPWFGEDRDSRTLEALGKVLGDDWFSHPIADCATGIPADTDVVLFPSNGAGFADAAVQQNSAECQGALAAFLDRGGRLVVDMGDNLSGGGFMAPGATGTPDLNFPLADVCGLADLTSEAAGPDALYGTADDHPLLFGPDRLPGTADDLTSSNIDFVSSCSIVHGNLAEGISLPADATFQLNASFGSGVQPVHGEYCLGAGRVILDTLSKEFVAHPPTGSGPSTYLLALLGYALSDDSACAPPVVAVSVDIKPGSCTNPLNVNALGALPVAIAGSADYDVSQIDLATVTLAGVPALRGNLADVTTAGGCAAGGDGMADLTLKFSNAAVGDAIPDADGSVVLLPLAGNLKAEFGGTPITGEDSVRVIRRK